MSAKYTFLAWDTPIENAPLKLALLQLANNADDNGFSYYSISKMAKACGMSERTFMRKISELEKMKVLTVERRANRPSLYTLVGDEMGVTLCHLQTAEVTGSHGRVTECHAQGDRVSHDPNSVPKSNPNSIKSNKSDRPSIDYEKVQSVWNEIMDKSPKISKLNPKRKRLIKKLFDDNDLTVEKFANYLRYVSQTESWKWCFETTVSAKGIKYGPRPFDYFLSEDVFLRAKEEI